MREKIWLHFLVDAFPIDEDKNVMAEKLSSIDGVLHILQQGQRNIFLADHDGAGSDVRARGRAQALLYRLQSGTVQDCRLRAVRYAGRSFRNAVRSVQRNDLPD